MIRLLTLILAFQLAGEVAARGAGLPVPGPLIGMLLLLALLVARKGPGEELAAVADGLLRHLSLLFVPAGVGVIVHIGLIRQEGAAIVTALVASTLIGVAVTGLVLHAFIAREGKAEP